MPTNQNDAFADSIKSKLPGVQTSIFAVMSALALENNALNLAQGFPNFDCSDKLKLLVSQYMNMGLNQYAPMPGVPLLRQRIAEKIRRCYHTIVGPEVEITITTGATQGIFAAVSAFVSPGDEVIIFEPAYDCYAPSIVLNGGIPKPITLHPPGFEMDWDLLKKTISPKTRLLIINNPHNPCGKVMSASDMLQLQEILMGTKIILLSDEVYEHLVFDNAQHQSVLLYPDLYNRSIITFSFGKTFHNTGWKIGYCVAPKNLSAEIRKAHQFIVFSVNTPIQHALAEYLKDPKVYQGLGNFYEFKRNTLLNHMENSGFRPLPCGGSYFQLFDYSAFSNENDLAFARRLVEEAGVATIPVSAFCTDEYPHQLIRICFAKNDETLQQGANQLKQWAYSM
ncbi:MAG: methionine aminotransferase [Saprospiraceae bacterium]